MRPIDFILRNAAAVLGVAVLVLSACSSSEPNASFDGTTCDFDGPDRVDAGGFEVTFSNQSGDFAALVFLELPTDETKRAEDLEFLGTGGPIPEQPDPDLAQPVGFILAEPGEEVSEEASLAAGGLRRGLCHLRW